MQKTGHGRTQPQQRRGNSFSNNANAQDNDLGLNDELHQAQRINTQLLQDLKQAKDQVIAAKIEKERVERKMVEFQKELKNWRNRPQELRYRGSSGGGVSSPPTNQAKTRSSRAASAMTDHSSHQSNKSYKRPTSSTGTASRANPLSIQYENQQMKLKIKSLEQQIHRTNRSLSRQSRSNNVNISQPIDVTARQLSDQNDEMRGKLRKTILLVKKFFLSFRRLQRALHKRQEDDISKFKVEFQACRHELRDYVEAIERGLDQGDDESKRTRNNRGPSGALSFQDRHNISTLSLNNSNNNPKLRAYKGDQQYITAENSNSTPTSKQSQHLMAQTVLSQHQHQNVVSESTPRLQSNNVMQNQAMCLSANNTQSTNDKIQQPFVQQSQEQQDMAEQLRRQLQSVQIEHRQAQDEIRILKGQNNDLIKQLSKNAAQIQQKVLDLQLKQNEQKQISDMKTAENQELEDQIDGVVKQNEEFRKQILQLSQREQKNVENVKNLQEQLNEATKNEKVSIVEIKQNLIERLDTIEQPLFKRVQELESVVGQKEKDLSQVQSKIKNLSKQSIAKIKKLEKDLADSSAKESQGKTQMKQLVDQLGNLHKKRNQELKSNDSEKKKVSQALEKTTNLVKSLQTENQKLKSNATKEESEKVKSLMKENSENAAIIKSLNSQNQKLIDENSKEKSEKVKINANFEKTVDDLKKQITKAKKQSQKNTEDNKKKESEIVQKHEVQLKKVKDQISVAEKKIKQHNDEKLKVEENAKSKQLQHAGAISQLQGIIKSLEQRQLNEKQKSQILQQENNLVSQQALKLKSHKEQLEKDHKNSLETSKILQKRIADMQNMMRSQQSDKQLKINQIMKKLIDYEKLIKENEEQKQNHLKQAENAKNEFDELIQKMSIENNMKIDQLIQTMQKQHEKDLQVAQSNSNSKYQEILNQQTSKLKVELETQLLEAEKSLKQSQDQVVKQQIQQLNQQHDDAMKKRQQEYHEKNFEMMHQIQQLSVQIKRMQDDYKNKIENLNDQLRILEQQNSSLKNDLQNLQKQLSDNTIASLSEKEKLHTLLNKTQSSHEKELQEQKDLQAGFKKQHTQMAKSLRDRIKELQTQLTQNDEQLIELEKKLINQKNADKQALEAQHKKEFEQQRSKNAEERKKWEEEKQQLTREKLEAVKNLQNEIREENDKMLKQQSDSKDQQQQNLLKQLKKRDEQIDQISNQMVDLKLKHSSLQSQIDEDQIKLQEKVKDIESYKKKLEKSQIECKEIQNEKIKVQEENLDVVNELKKQISERDSLIETANNQLQEYNMQKMFIKTSLKDLIKDCSIIANESGSFAEESFNADLDFEAIIKALRQEIDDLRQRVDDQSKMNISKITENSARFHQQELKKDNVLKEIKEKNDEIQKHNSQLKEQLGEAKRLADESKQMLAKAQSNFQNLRKQTEISESKKQKYKDRINELEKQVNQDTKKGEQVNNQKNKEVQELKNTLTEKTQSLKEMCQKMDKLKNQNQGLNKQNTDTIQKNKKLKAQNDKLEQQLKDSHQDKSSAETELKAYQGLSDRDMNKKDEELKQLKADNEVLKKSLEQSKNKKPPPSFHDIIQSKSNNQLQILRRAKYSSKSWILIEQSPQKYLWIPQFELNDNEKTKFTQSILQQNQNSKVLQDLNENYQTNIKNLMEERNQLNQCAIRGSDPGGFIGSLSIGGENMDKQSIKDKMRANKAETEILKLQKKIGELLILIYELPDDQAAKKNVKKIAELTRQNEQLGERYQKLQKELTNIELKVEKTITPRAVDDEERKTPRGESKAFSQTSDQKPPRRPASVRGGAGGALSPGASYMQQRPGTEVHPGEQFLFEQQSAMSIRSGSQAFQDIQTLIKKLQDSERQIKESQNTQDLLLNQNRQLKKVILALEKKLKKISNKQGEAAVQHGRSVLAKFLKGCPYAAKQLEQILIVAMNVLQFSQKQIAQIQEERVKLFGQPPKDDKKKKVNAFVRMFQKKKK